MDEKNASKRPPARKKPRRRILKAAVGLALLLAVLVGALPWLLGTPPARAWVVGRINAKLAPGSAALGGISLSWTRPIVLSGVALRDSKGKVVLAAKSVRLDRGILGLLASRPNYGTITVDGAAVDAERRPDGSIDLVEALGPAMKSDDPSKPSDPNVAVAVVIKGGSLKFSSPELVEPFEAPAVDGTLTIARGKPLEASATLVGEGRSIDLHATFDHRAPASAPGDLAATVTGKDWPIHVREAGVDGLGRFRGTIEARREGGRWSILGEPALIGVRASGPALAGDSLAIDRIAATCDLGQTATGWSVRRLEVTSPFATIAASGSIPAGEGAKLNGRVDLAALAKLAPRALRLKDGLTLEKGTATVRADFNSAAGSERLDLTAGLDDLVAAQGGRPFTLREPAHIAALVSRSGGKIAIEKLEVKAAGVDVTASGDLDAGVKLHGAVDLAALDAQARDLLDLGQLKASGHARVAADYRHFGETYKARFAVECKELDVAGLTASPIHREMARAEGIGFGPRSANGLPSGWQEMKADVKSADLKVDLTLTNDKDGLAVLAAAGLDVASPVPGRAEAKAAFVMKGRAFEVGELRAGIVPREAEAARGAVGLAVRGRLDLATGEGAFTPIPGTPVAAVGLANEGLRVAGLGRADVPLKVSASMVGDLAAVDRMLAAWSGTPLKGLAGVYGTQLRLSRSTAGKVETDGQVDVADIAAMGLRGPVTLAWRGGYLPEKDQVEIGGVNLVTHFGSAALAGNLFECKSRQIYDLNVALVPRWEALDPIVAAKLEPQARLRATVRPIHWKGYYKADSTPQLLAQQIADVVLDVTEASAFGVTLTPAPVVLHFASGNAAFDPIKTTANGGPLTLVANLGLDEAYGVWLRLFPGTRIEGAAINDAVSNSVLAYVAPVLAQATHVNGKVSVDIAGATIPMTATGSAEVRGRVTFEGVEFLSGPLGTQLATMVGQPSPKLTLRQPMLLNVTGGRVQQSGLSIPLPGGSTVGIDGSVGFDKTLDLRASVPLTARMLGLDPKFEKVVAGTKLAIPIKGTMSHPGVDQRALASAVQDAAKSAAAKGFKSEAEGLLQRVAGPNPLGGEPKGKPGRRDSLGTLEDLGRQLLDPKKP